MANEYTKGQDELFQMMKHNADEAENIYNVAVSLKLQNTQEFINWQDRLNQVSITKDEDA